LKIAGLPSNSKKKGEKGKKRGGKKRGAWPGGIPPSLTVCANRVSLEAKKERGGKRRGPAQMCSLFSGTRQRHQKKEASGVEVGFTEGLLSG